MLYYEYLVNGKLKVDKKLLKEKKRAGELLEDKLIRYINLQLSKEKTGVEKERLFAYSCEFFDKKDKTITVKFVLAVNHRGEELAEKIKQVELAIGLLFQAKGVSIRSFELPPQKLLVLRHEQKVCKEGGRVISLLGLPFIGDEEMSFCQQMVGPVEDITLEEAKTIAESLMADDRYIEELERIFSDVNEHRFVVHPVHYRIVAEEEEQRNGLLSLLVQVLHHNKRLSSLRMDFYRNLGGRNNPDTVKGFMRMSSGSTVVIDSVGDSSIQPDRLKLLGNLAEKYSNDTLFIILDNGNPANNGELYLERLQESVDMVTVGSAPVNKEDVIKHLQSMADSKGLSQLFLQCPPRLNNKSRTYNRQDVKRIFCKWSKGCAQQVVYKAYANVHERNGRKAIREDYEQSLQDMIGLARVKELVKELVAVGEVNKLRKENGFKDGGRSLHMLFTGNPGSAKTTVARLLTKILAQKGVIDAPKLIEVGRADLVGKYVGWTANLVKEKFQQATGGVLFVDEAYALCGEGRDFGVEAINTLVQEMENHRHDVVVIFAGYSEKMKKFLQENEGLKSRIPYHLDFPDYNPQELMEIMELMAEQQGLTLDEGAKEKCLQTFSEVVKQENFGNGRFVRNLLEHATAKQALRLTANNKQEDISKEMLVELKAEDFDVTKVMPKTPRKSKLGFLA